MATWQWILLALLLLVLAVTIAFAAWLWRSGRSLTDATADLKALGGDVVRLPARLGRLAADPRVPRRARWMLIGLAIYVASPIDPVPDFIPVLGHLDEVILVPVILARVRRMIPPAVWAEYFAARSTRADHPIGSNTRADRSG
jgi:uncharacterized membrane protein YkvA (DUF1232 family)